MKPKHLLTIFMLLFVGAISAFSLTSNSPEINTPVGNEEPTKPDKTGLVDVITEAERLAEADYTPTSWSTLQTALTAAKTVNKDGDATQDAVNSATSTLQSAITNLIKKADKTELQNVITATNNLTEDDYTPNSWKALAEALNAADTVNKNGNATQDAVNSAANTLQTAIDNLIEKADKTALEEIIGKTKTENEKGNKDFWTSATNALTAANTINNDEEASQTQVDDATLALQKAFNIAPFNYANANYQTKYVEYYGTWNENNATYKKVFNESDFGGLKMMIDSISTLYKDKENEIPENEIYGEEDKTETIQIVDKVEIKEDGDTIITYKNVEVIIPGKRGIIRQYNECIDNRAKSFENKKGTLKALLDKIDANQEYNYIQQHSSYITPKEWYKTEDFDHSTPHNFTSIILYINYLNEEINFADLKINYGKSIDYFKGLTNEYFAEADRNEDNEDWKKTNGLITNFTTLLSNTEINVLEHEYTFNSIKYTSLSLMQDAMDKEINNIQDEIDKLESSSTALKKELQALITTTKELYPLLNRNGNKYKELNQAIENAQINDETKTISVYNQAIQTLQSKYKEVLEYYNGLKTDLQTSIEDATKLNETYLDEKLTSTITQASAILNKDGVTEAELLNAIDDLTKQTALVSSRSNLKTGREKLISYQKIYGDEDNEMAKLLTASESPADESIETFIAQIEERLKLTEDTWAADTTNLGKQIVASIQYYNRWAEKREEVLPLKSCYESAQKVYAANTTEGVRNISALKKAYTELYDVYVLVGGTSDPFLSREVLLKKIAEAEACYKKYHYSELSRLIETAKSYTENDANYLLEQQTANLTIGMENAITQYKLIINNLDKQKITTQNRLKERYNEEDTPKDYTALLATITDSLIVSEIVPEERVCTNITILQNYYLGLQEIITLVDNVWQNAVSKLAEAITDTRNKQETTYPDNIALKDAIELAQAKYESINTPTYSTIAAVNNVIKELDNALLQVEGTLRRNIADIFLKGYDAVSEQYKAFGSDDKSQNYSNARSYLAEKEELYTELNTSSLTIPYTLNELNGFCDSINIVKEIYTLFYNSASTLQLNIASALEKEKMYYDTEYNEKTQADNILDKAIDAAYHALHKSESKEMIDESNYALKDSISVTKLAYDRSLSALKASRNTAKTKHNMYYGSSVTESEIITVYEEAGTLITDGITIIRTLNEMTAKLDTCYAEAAKISVQKETEIQALIALSDSLNLQMEDDKFDEGIAEAINAKYCNDGRIDSIKTHLVKLQGMYNKQLNKYETACTALSDKLTNAKELLAIRNDEILSDTITAAEKVLEKAGIVIAKNKAKYKELIDATEWLTEIMEIVNKQIETELVDAREALVKARAEALAKHNLFYGTANTDSIAILKVYKEAEAFLTSNDLADLILMTDSVNESYVQPAVECSQKEAELDNLIRKSTPLVTLMDNTELAKIIIKARECRNRMDGRIVAIDSVRPSLQEVYEADCIKYDKAAYELSDSIDVAKELLEIKKDEALQNAVTAAEAVLDAADKTSASSTKYTELVMQTPILAKEMERVRILIKEAETGIYAPSAEDREVEIYTTQGFLVKRVRLSDSNPFQSIPEGVYIMDGKKIYIHAK